MDVPRLGVKLELQLLAYTTATATWGPSCNCDLYIIAHSNTGSLTHWGRAGIEPVSSWILVRLVTAEPQWEHLSKEILIQKDACTPMFITALFTITKTQKEGRVHQQMNGWRSCAIHTQWTIAQSYKKMMSFAATWVDLEVIRLGEVSQRKTKSMMPLTCGI